MPESTSSGSRPSDRAGFLFAATAGGLLALGLLKFGNPVILDYKIVPPQSLLELRLYSWPAAWAYPWLAVVVLAGIGVIATARAPQGREGSKPGKWFVWLPLGWLLWQGLSATQTVRWTLTEATLKHFAACVVCFYLGLLGLSRVRNLAPMWALVLAGFVVVIGVGWDQHFGGFEAARRHIYSQPDWQNLSPLLLKKIASDRIYSTLFYPNTLAGAILLFLPMLLVFVLRLQTYNPLRWVLGAMLAAGGMGCLYWSGSKAAWLIALGVAAVGWCHLTVARRWKVAMVGVLLTAGLAGFFLKYAGYFEKGATSVGARFDYWSAAAKITSMHPLLGSGPGTFGVLYRHLKGPDAEMARLTHNDYLQQASDSGLVGGLLYGALIIGSLLLRRTDATAAGSSQEFGVWLGLLSWAGQGCVEFGLYVPALSWPAFMMLGWLWKRPLGAQEGRPKPSQTSALSRGSKG